VALKPHKEIEVMSLIVAEFTRKKARDEGPCFVAMTTEAGETVYLHRLVTGSDPETTDVVFLNGNTLDCRRDNLRVIPRQAEFDAPDGAIRVGDEYATERKC
jgi:hypothetical protein